MTKQEFKEIRLPKPKSNRILSGRGSLRKRWSDD